MGDATPADPPLTGDVCGAWAQVDALADDVRELHGDALWCSILATASDVLWSATGRRWRNVSISETVQVYGLPCVPWGGYLATSAVGYGYGYNTGLRGARLYRDEIPRALRLPRDDVTAVTAVTLNGEALDDWELHGNWLARLDRFGWHRDTDITYSYGKPRPAPGELATITLASEIGRWMAGKGCQLPQRVQSVTRQGVSFAVLDDLKFLDDGLTGIASVDMWITSVNPSHQRRNALSWSPDRLPVRRP
jgi:hypothetical protein